MAVVWDNFARTFMVTGPLPEKAVVRQHYFQDVNEKRKVVYRQRMRSGAREVMNVLAKNFGKKLTFKQLHSAMPTISVDTLQVRLSLLTSRHDIQRFGTRGNFTYSMPEGSTFMSTPWSR